MGAGYRPLNQGDAVEFEITDGPNASRQRTENQLWTLMR
ncbi:MAG TPA: hypothetical protein VEI49_09330 [Terriglobales bacterium]|nr:hypothetical protein [Terriglobales bacterium]